MRTYELKRLKDLENENRRLKQFYAEVSLENAALREVLQKKYMEHNAPLALLLKKK
jgi:putative transposase